MTDNAPATTTFAVAFAEALENLGGRHAFGVSGGAISFFWSALGGTGVEVTHFRYESGAAFAACEASIASGAPVVVFVTTGPGLTNVLTGAYAARHERPGSFWSARPPRAACTAAGRSRRPGRAPCRTTASSPRGRCSTSPPWSPPPTNCRR